MTVPTTTDARRTAARAQVETMLTHMAGRGGPEAVRAALVWAEQECAKNPTWTPEQVDTYRILRQALADITGRPELA